MVAILITIIIITLSYFFINLREKQKYKDEQLKKIKIENEKKEILESPEYKNYLLNINYFFSEIKYERQNYFIKDNAEKIKAKYKDTFKFFNREIFNSTDNKNILNFLSIFDNLENKVRQWNEQYIQNELEKNKDLFDDIDGKSLDLQQRLAVVVDEMNELVIAGAGSGKTLTISGKVKYLVDKKGIKPEEILLISFTKKSAAEMTDRIKKKLNINVTSSTFHKLGLDIIREYNKDSRIISNDKCDTIIEELNIQEEGNEKNINVVKEELMKKIVDDYLTYKVENGYENINKVANLKDYDNLIENYEKIKRNEEATYMINKRVQELSEELWTINREKVKSNEEVMIANFLYEHKVKYQYERSYPFYQGENKYEPDFYLSDYDIYLEHFGITRDNRTPQFSKEEEKEYVESMEWKRKLHKDNNTTLIETYSYYNKDGVLLTKLEDLLIKNNVKLQSRNKREIYNKIYESIPEKYLKGLESMLCRFINAFKSCGYKEYDFDKLIEISKTINISFIREKNIIFLEIAREIYNIYQAHIEKESNIDFNDMINTGKEIIENGYIPKQYKYIIIDEYQDISYSRYMLIKALKEKTNAKLMCVGDDWQSIYRFSGSSVGMFVNFDKYFSPTVKLRIEKTYRNSQDLIDIAGTFVMQNKNQIIKNLRSQKNTVDPLIIVYYDKPYINWNSEKQKIESLEKQKQLIEETLEAVINKIIKDNGIKSSIMILYRYNKTASNIKERVKKLKKDHPQLKINYISIHKSKGLEADNVILLGFEDSWGFPAKKSEDTIMSLVLPPMEDFVNADERRLFYVAITRTRNKTYIITPSDEPSVFIKEIKNHINETALLSYDNEKLTLAGKC